MKLCFQKVTVAFAQILFTIIMSYGLAMAGTNDYFPQRNGITLESTNRLGTRDSIEFNLYTDDKTLSFIRGYGFKENTGFSDERDFITAKKLNDTDKYQHTLSGLTQKDTIRLSVFIENCANKVDKTYPPDDCSILKDDYSRKNCSELTLEQKKKEREKRQLEYEERIAKNTKVIIDWSNGQEVIATITAENSKPRSISDIVSLRYQGNYTLKPINTVKIFTINDFAEEKSKEYGRTDDISYDDKRLQKNEKSITFNIGDIISGWQNIKAVYFDFEVIDNKIKKIVIP